MSKLLCLMTVLGLVAWGTPATNALADEAEGTRDVASGPAEEPADDATEAEVEPSESSEEAPQWFADEGEPDVAAPAPDDEGATGDASDDSEAAQDGDEAPRL